ncbi:MAG: DUF885 family protein, partial [Eubacterium sp.]|nr:DUF885 family protein [Eubacterium sp.]
MSKHTRLKLKRLLAAVLAGTMLLGSTACRTPEEFYHEVILGETSGNGKKTSKKDKDKDKEEKTTEGDTTSSVPEEDPVDYATEENAEFQALLEEYFMNGITSDTLSYNSLVKHRDSFPEAEAEMEVATLGDPRMDKDAVAEAKEKDEEFYNRLMEFEDVTLTEDETFTFKTLKDEYERSMKLYDNIYFYEPFSPMRGEQENLTSNFVDFPFDDKKDVDDYVAFSAQVRDYFDTLIEFEYE